MKDYSYHSLFYYKILSALRGFVSGDGRRLSDHDVAKDAPVFYIGWHPRTGMEFRHNFERNRFLENRDRYVLGENHSKGMHPVVIVREVKNTDRAVVYEEAVRYLFDDDWQDALRELLTLLEKFYVVSVESVSELGTIDMESEGRHGSHSRVNNLQNHEPVEEDLPF